MYPNPSVGGSTLSFYVSTKQFVSVRIFSTNGVLIKELTAQTFAAGRHVLEIESDQLSQGFYFIEVDKGGSKALTKFIKM
ncbi:MAG: T9SS type A sorting domain-containing protein [Bacteroidota bacterium]